MPDLRAADHHIAEADRLRGVAPEPRMHIERGSLGVPYPESFVTALANWALLCGAPYERDGLAQLGWFNGMGAEQ